MNGLGLISLKSFGISLEKSKDGLAVKKETPVQKPENEGPNSEIVNNKGSITGYYSNDLNLIELNTEVLKIINTQTVESISMHTKSKEQELYKIQLRQTKIERESSIRTIKRAEEEINKCKDNTKHKEYSAEIQGVLQEYSKIGTLKQYVTFGNGIVTHNIQETNQMKIYRLSLIEKFLEISNKYVPINISRKISFVGCPSCGYPLPKIDNNDGDNPNCINCNTEIVQFSSYIPDDDLVPIKKASGGSEGRNNFIKDMSRYQGKLKNSKIPETLFSLLDEYFTIRSFPIGEEN